MKQTQEFNKANPHWWVLKLPNAKWISVYPQENKWGIFHQLGGGQIVPVANGTSNSPEEACSESIQEAKIKGFLN